MNLGNFLVSSDFTVKVSDFGTCKVIKDSQKAKSIIGAPLYHSPEIEISYSFPCDVWSFGLVITDVCCNNQFVEPPKPSNKQEQIGLRQKLISNLQPQDKQETQILVEEIGAAKLLTFLLRRFSALQIVEKFAPQFKKLVEECLHICDKERLTFIEIINQFNNIDIGEQTKPNMLYFIDKWNK